MKIKTCTKCRKKFPATNKFFYKDGNRKDGLRSWCKKCISLRDRYWYKKNRNEKLKQATQWYINNRNRALKQMRQWYIDNREKEIEQRKQRYWGNREKELKQNKQYRKDNRDKYNAYNAKRRARKFHATPVWANEDVIKLYYVWANILNMLFRPYIEFEVDHEIPLQGKNICGLHVENNLQILPATLNLEKKNKWPLTRKEQERYKGFKLY